ncbi:hypothetical protein GCM10027299_23900 [Larkinella ripae]
MSNHLSSDPIAQYSSLLPEWGQAAEEIYQNYHFLNQALSQTERSLLPEEALQKLDDLKKLLVNTIAHLIQDLPPTTHRISNKNTELIDRFNAHTTALKKINQRTDEIFEDLQHRYPSLKNWFESLSDEC